MTYQPGDAFEVRCPNRTSEVEQLLYRLGLQEQVNHRVQISLRKDTKKKGKCSGLHLFYMQQKDLILSLKRNIRTLYWYE